MSKPLKPSPQYYAFIFPPMQEIANEMGYNLLLHGSMNRDCDLVAVPWVNEPKPELELIQKLHEFLSGYPAYEYKEQYNHSILPGGRSSYVIHICRGKVSRYFEFKNEPVDDAQIYLDISITPLIVS